MTGFKKSFCRSVDAKGRLMLPVEYRETLVAHSSAEGFFLTVIYDRLTAYTYEEWQPLYEKLIAVKSPVIAVRNFVSKTLGLAEELVPDAQGRVRISQSLMRAGRITKDIQLVGKGATFEIWDQAEFDNLIVEDISVELAKFDLSF